MERSLIAYNRGGEGAGVKINNGTVRNCLIIGNRADISPFNGGGVYQENGTLQNCTVVGNRANLAGGGAYLSGSNARIRNCIIADNTATTSDNLHRVAGWFEYSCAFPAVPDDAQASHNTGLAPQFIDGKAGDYRLLPGSPAIDSGSATGAPAADYAGNPRPLDGDGDATAAYDMGAYEAPAFTDVPLRCNVVGSPLEGFAPLTVTFTAHVAGPDTNGMQYAWNFGDGQSLPFGPQREVTHVYGFGTFDIALTASNAASQTASIVRPALVHVAPNTAYVSPAGSHIPPFGDWATAATNLQDAVDAALDTPELKTKVVVGDGVYRLTNTLSLVKNITVESVNGAAATVIDAGGAAMGLRAVFLGASDAVLKGVTVSNAFTTLAGAGIYLQGGRVRECIVANNRTTGIGGGIYMASGTTVSNCLVRGNRVESISSGAGVYVAGNSLLVDSEIRSNEITGNGYGAGVYIVGVARDCWIHSNTNKYRGGGVATSGGTLEDCLVEWNRGSEGGGIFSDNGIIRRNRFLCNSGSGGAAYLRTGSIFRNNLVVGNHSPNVGGGVRIQHGTGQLVENNTLAGNYAGTYGGGLYQETGAVTNTIVWGNQAKSGGQDFRGSITNIGYSCVSDLPADPVKGIVNQAPLFEKPGSGAGLNLVLGRYALKRGSPAADSGLDLAWMAGAVDLAGDPRVLNGRVNMGAYEKLIPPPATLLLLR